MKFQLSGFADFEKQIIALAEGVRMDTVLKNTLAKAAESSMQSVYYAALAYAPYDIKNPRDEHRPIHMRDTLRLTSGLATEKDRQSSMISDDAVVVARVTVKRSAVSLAQEYGTKKIPARPFLRPALQYGAQTVINDLKNDIGDIIASYASKLSRKK